MRTRSTVAAVSAIVVSALIGGVFGKSALATSDSVPDHYRTFTAALTAIQSQYAEPVESDRMVYGAINGMLQTLDPHSSFMDPRTYAQMRERQEGRYYGLGLTISAIDGDITAVRVFEGSPAFSNGIRRGDVIAEVEGVSTKGWTTEATVNKLKGPKGTFVNIGVRRKGFERLLEMRVMRDQVSIPSLSASFMIDGTTGYVGITDFAEHTDEDLGEALEAMTKKGMKRLVLDLRGNPGGQLDQAIRITNRFVPEGLDGGLHARPRAEFGFGLSRHRHAGLPEHPDGGAREPQQRERLGDRVGRAAGLRPRARGRRDDVRQGARAVGVSRERRRGPRVDHGALLHAERPLDSAAVGRHVRRVPDLHVEGAGRAGEDRGSVEVHDRWPQGVFGRRHRARHALRRAG